MDVLDARSSGGVLAGVDREDHHPAEGQLTPPALTMTCMASGTLTAVDPRLAALPDAAIGLVLGMSVANPSAKHAGRVSLLVDELRRRGTYLAMLATLDPKLAAAIDLADRADRGQCWAQTGHPR